MLMLHHNKVVAVPFKGEKLFGKALDPFLVETKGKKKVLPTINCSSKLGFKQGQHNFSPFKSQSANSQSPLPPKAIPTVQPSML